VGRDRIRRASSSVVLLCAVGACNGGDEPAQPRFACTFEVSFSSCHDPRGSPWTPTCITVGNEELCEQSTRDHTERTATCEYTTRYRGVEIQPGECAEGSDSSPGEGLADGEACSSLGQCRSGLCVPQYYCTTPCRSDGECQPTFDGGCCVGEGSLGYCLAAAECSRLCPEHAYPWGIPTLCYCEDGLHWNQDGTACIPPSAPGQWCAMPGDCASGYCLSGFDANGDYAAWCSMPCGADGDCTALLGAAQVEAACCGPTTDGVDACVIDGWCR
jgi:hypothetical protein